MIQGLELALILLASAVFVVVLFRRLNLPPLLGCLIVGVAIGPNATFDFDDLQKTPAVSRDIKDIIRADPRLQ